MAITEITKLNSASKTAPTNKVEQNTFRQLHCQESLLKHTFWS